MIWFENSIFKIMLQINPFIHFNGNAEDAFNFYRSVFGGEFTKLLRFRDLTESGIEWPVKEANKILQIALPIGETSVLMGSDVPEMLGHVNEQENRSKISLSADSREEANRIFTLLSVGGQIEMPIGDSPWGTYFGMFRDRYGIEWMIEVSNNKLKA